MGQYRKLCRKLEEITGTDFSEKNFKITIAKVNRLRELIAETKKLTATHTPNPLGGLEMMLVEFSALSYYGDLDECLEVMKDIYQTAKARVDAEIGYEKQYLRLVWVTPPADPLLINYAEDLGGRIVGSEYLINQTTPIFSSQGDPFEILAESHLSATLMGSSVYRANLILELARRTGAEGVIISGIFGSSHCPYETQPIVSALRMEGIPVLTFDVAAPGKIKMQSQIHNRMSAFMESLRRRSRSYAR
jgi:benzoyl-CoA reductase/2-hydroxyglutaryl-CoA dehydratase subunit BcrC/BadD/HgdB